MNVFKQPRGREIGYGDFGYGDEFTIHTDGSVFWFKCDKAGGEFSDYDDLTDAWLDFRAEIADEFNSEATVAEIDEEFAEAIV